MATQLSRVAQLQQRWAVKRLFSPRETAAAMCALSDASFQRCQQLSRFSTAREASMPGAKKVHVEIPLRFLNPSAVDRVRQHVPDEVLLVFEVLYAAAVAFAQESLAHPSVSAAVQNEILVDIEKKSVLRLLKYDAGVGCRPHTDPGLCTALLKGSAAGLELNTSEAADSAEFYRGIPGSFRYAPEDPSGRVNCLDMLPHWESPPASDGDALVMAGNMLQVVSDKAIGAVLHRVRHDWEPLAEAAAEEVHRYNIVVELRPASPKRWYKMTA